MRRFLFAVAGMVFAAPLAFAQSAPPPRTIADIVAILDQEKPDPTKRAGLITTAEAAEPAGADARVLGRFLFERCIARQTIGRVEDAIEDCRRAKPLLEQVGDEGTAYRAHQQVAIMLRGTGQHRQSQAEFQEQAKAIEASRRALGRLATIYRSICQGAVLLGDMKMAEDYGGYTEDLYKTLAGNPRYSGPPLEGVLADVSICKAAVAEARGRHAEAEKHYVAGIANQRIFVEKAAKTVGLPTASAEQFIDLMQVNLGKTKLAQGRLSEAEVDIREALLRTLRRGGKYTPPTANFALNLAAILREQGRLDEAMKLISAAMEIQTEVGLEENSAPLIQTQRNIADTLLLKRDWTGAMAAFDAASAKIAAQRASGHASSDVSRTQGSIGRIVTMARTGRAAEAVRLANEMVTFRTERMGPRHYETAEAKGLLGIALAAANSDAEALAAFREAVPVMISASRQAETEDSGLATRDFYVQTIIEDYIVLLSRVQGTAAAGGLDAGAESFRLADAARGRNVQRALAASAARAAVRDPALADLVRQEQDQQRQIGAQFGLLGQLLALPPGQRDDKLITALRTDVDKLRDRRAAIRQQIEKQFPDYVNLIDPRPPSIEEMRAVLRPGEALVSFYLAQENSFVWVVPKDGPVAFAAAPMGAKAIEQKVMKLRQALEPQAETLGDIPAFDLATAHELYATLLAPVQAGWQPAKNLFVVTNGALGLLPLALLPTAPATADANAAPLFSAYRSVPWLAKTHAVTQLPSTAALKTLRGLPQGAKNREPLIGFGDPFFNAEQAREAAAGETRIASADPVAVRGAKLQRRNAPQTAGVDSAELGLLPRLPDTADELRSVARAVRTDPAKSLYLGRDASEAAVKKAKLAGYRVVAFATHGLVPGELNGLTQPALALSAPAVSNSEGDGLLTMEEILSLKLDADWVVLSACNTGAGAGAGAEAASGLGRAFFYAGTRALLLTNWSVHSASAKDLVTDLFKRQADDPALGRAEALRQAMTALIDGPGYQEGGQTLFSYAHPIFWAPYSLMGDGG